MDIVDKVKPDADYNILRLMNIYKIDIKIATAKQKIFVYTWNKMVKAVEFTLVSGYDIHIPEIDLHFHNPDNR